MKLIPTSFFIASSSLFLSSFGSSSAFVVHHKEPSISLTQRGLLVSSSTISSSTSTISSSTTSSSSSTTSSSKSKSSSITQPTDSSNPALSLSEFQQPNNFEQEQQQQQPTQRIQPIQPIISTSSIKEAAQYTTTTNNNKNNNNNNNNSLESQESLETLRQKTLSKAIPFLQRPTILNGELAGDVGFDPLQLAQTKEDLYRYREAEIKHARLAMLAFIGWPLSELADEHTNMNIDMTAYNELSTAVTRTSTPPLFSNGDYTGIHISANYWFISFVLASFIDVYGVYRFMNKDDKNYFPGNLGFDPLQLYPKVVDGNDDVTDQQKMMQLAEIKHGRVAMMAVLCLGVEEYVTKESALDILF